MAIKFFTTGIHGIGTRRIKEFENVVIKGYEFQGRIPEFGLRPNIYILIR